MATSNGSSGHGTIDFPEPPYLLRSVKSDGSDGDFALKEFDTDEGYKGIVVMIFSTKEKADFAADELKSGLEVFQMKSFAAADQMLSNLKNKGVSHVSIDRTRDEPNSFPIDSVIASIRARNG